MIHLTGEPRTLEAKFDSRCHSCRCLIRRGVKVLYYPESRSVYCWPCGEPRFIQHVQNLQNQNLIE